MKLILLATMLGVLAVLALPPPQTEAPPDMTLVVINGEVQYHTAIATQVTMTDIAIQEAGLINPTALREPGHPARTETVAGCISPIGATAGANNFAWETLGHPAWCETAICCSKDYIGAAVRTSPSTA